MNDGYSIGCYGLNDVLYAKFLYARWAELTGTVDECDFSTISLLIYAHIPIKWVYGRVV